jgi:hypothetical protein
MDKHFERAIGDGARRWLLDERLKDVWERLDVWLSRVSPGRQEDAAAYVIGALALPTWLIPERGASGAMAAEGRRIREKNKAAAGDLTKAAQALRKAADLIAAARGRTHIVPDVAITPFHFFVNGVPSSCLMHIPSYFWVKPDTCEMLLGMADELEGVEPLSIVPGFESQKSGWRDWLREAQDSLREAAEIYGGRINLREVDWFRLAEAAVGDAGIVTRDSVRSALRHKTRKSKIS